MTGRDYSIKDLIDFETEVVDLFNDGQLRSPVHLSGGNEKEVIEIFKDIKPEDWVFTTYRSHYHALLKGMPRDRLLNWIKDNKSIHVMDKEYKIFTSAIVGGCLPIALGVAKAIKMKESNERVWIFVGDMTAESGLFHEVTKYAARNSLPINFIVEDNGLSTDTPTQESWGNGPSGANIWRYTYTRKYPHYGTGKFITKIWENPEDPKAKGF